MPLRVITTRQEALAVHMVLVAFPGTKVDTVFAPVKDEVEALAGMRRKPKRRRRGTP